MHRIITCVHSSRRSGLLKLHEFTRPIHQALTITAYQSTVSFLLIMEQDGHVGCEVADDRLHTSNFSLG